MIFRFRVYRLMDRAMQRPTEDGLILVRNLGIGGAAASIAILLQLLVVGITDDALLLSVKACCVSLPMWLCIAAFYDTFISLGPESYAHVRKPSTYYYIAIVGIVASCSLIVAVGAVIFHLSESAFYILLYTSALAGLLFILFHAILAAWFFGADGPGSKKPKR
jgi:hypothetical protein